MKLSAPIHVLKKQAKELKKTQSIPLNQALDLIARREGYSSWSLLQSKSDDILPRKYDEVLDYLQPGDLVLVGGRPGMGKTSFAVGLFVQAIKSLQAKHYLFTLEQDHKGIARRIAGYDELIGENNERFELDYSDDISAHYIIEKSKSGVSKGSVIVVDYLQLLDHKRSHPPLQDQVEQLKAYAKEKGCILIFISQVDRAVESRVDKRPAINDIKLINPLDIQSFNKIMFLYRRRDEKQPTQVEITLCRPKTHTFTVNWDPVIYRFWSEPVA